MAQSFKRAVQRQPTPGWSEHHQHRWVLSQPAGLLGKHCWGACTVGSANAGWGQSATDSLLIQPNQPSSPE